MRVLVIERSAAFAEALACLFAQTGIAADHASFEDAEAVARSFRPTLAIVDADADATAVTAVARVVEESGRCRLLLLSHDATRECAFLAERLGAVGWTTRHSNPDQLLAAVRRSHAAAEPGAVRPTHTAVRQLRAARERAVLDRLTERELEVLRLVMIGRRNLEVAGRLGISPNTVRTHVQNILAKTGVRTRLEAATLARRAGLQASPEPATAGLGG